MSTTKNTLQSTMLFNDHRNDVDGLRAIAILAVLLYHAHAGFTPGGFVGVDMFFVLSGFVITRLILPQITAQRFSFWDFAQRRARRLFPVLFLVAGASIAAAAVMFTPPDFYTFSKSVAALAVFATNVQFWREMGYFDAGAEIKPLLHTWSLSLEIQFYVVFPVFLWVLRRVGVPLFYAVVAVLAASLAACLWMTAQSASTAFYLLPFRAWEFALGALLAFPHLAAPLKPRWLREGLSAIGAVLVLYAIGFLSAKDAYPGVRALLPCLGTALLLLSYHPERPALLTRALQLRPLVFIGLISYSLYVWHWPVLVFWQYWTLEPLTFARGLPLLLACVPLAIVSWRYVEQPFRRLATTKAQNRVVFGLAGVTAALFVVGVVGFKTKGLPQRFESPLREYAASIARETSGMQTCYTPSLEAIQRGEFCVPVPPAPQPVTLLLGDSMADSIAPVLIERFAAKGKTLVPLISHGCVIIDGYEKPGVDANAPNQRYCREFTKQALKLISERPGIERVYLYTTWGYNIEGDTGQYAAGMRQTIATLEASGVPITLVYPAPFLPDSVSIPRHALITKIKHGADALQTLPLADFWVKMQPVFTMLDGFAAEFSLNKVYLHTALCDETACQLEHDNAALYVDSHHLSGAGAARVGHLFAGE